MAWFASNAAQIVLAIPMIAMLFAALFRLDGWIASPGGAMRESHHDHRLSGWDADGGSLCIEPDGTVRNRAGELMAQPRAPKVRRRAFAEWERECE